MTPEEIKQNEQIEKDRARSNRIAALMQSPGYPDLVRLLSELEYEAIQQVNTFKGWDHDQKSDLMARQQAVSGMKTEILKRLQNYLLAGNAPPVHNTEESLADAMQGKIENESRVPGTY